MCFKLAMKKWYTQRKQDNVPGEKCRVMQLMERTQVTQGTVFTCGSETDIGWSYLQGKCPKMNSSSKQNKKRKIIRQRGCNESPSPLPIVLCTVLDLCLGSETLNINILYVHIITWFCPFELVDWQVVKTVLPEALKSLAIELSVSSTLAKAQSNPKPITRHTFQFELFGLK